MTGQVPPVAVYLQSDDIALRAVDVCDVPHASAWYEGDSTADDDVTAVLCREEVVPWGNSPRLRLIAVNQCTGDTVGGCLLERRSNRIGTLTVTVRGERRGKTARNILTIVVPWALGELGLLSVRIDVPDDDSDLIAAAERADMRPVVVRREWIVRSGGRVDLLTFERTNPAWGMR